MHITFPFFSLPRYRLQHIGNRLYNIARMRDFLGCLSSRWRATNAEVQVGDLLTILIGPILTGDSWVIT